jgi:hypothetical protein
MKTPIFRSLQRIGFSLLVLAAATSVGQSRSSVLTDAQAQTLIQKFQAQPATPLTKIETQHLLNYFIAQNTSQGSANAAQSQTQSGTSMPVVAAPTPPPSASEAKKAKPTRIGIAVTKTDMGAGTQAQNAGESLRLLESQYLQGPKIEVVMLASLLESQAQVEAKEKACDYVVYSAMTQKKSGGMGLLRGASTLMSVIPVAGAARGVAGAIAASATASAAASGVASMSSQVKAKNDVTLEYHMFAAGNTTPVLENKATLKAKTDGEDVITPLVEAAATSIVDKVLPKN